ncbi:MAG: DUF1015 domain-containing protein [Acidimicrobiia bacterium]|nr:DUF1015 family protein [Acidimicrobiia bacterium]NNF63287.1 DUF1015 domain-containing protein [Acidimicrobiia bacterium]
MALIRALDAYVPRPDVAGDVVSPPISSIDAATTEGDAIHPLSFRRVMRPPEDPQTGEVDDETLVDSGLWLRDLIEHDVFVHHARPALFVYRLTTDLATTTGLVADVSVRALEADRVRRHEDTVADSELTVTRHTRLIGAYGDPVALAHASTPDINRAIARVMDGSQPDLDFEDGDIRQQLWAVTNEPTVDELLDAYNALEKIYITDGHHRSAAAARYAAVHRAAGTPGDDHEWFLGALFSEDQVRILEFNRCVDDTQGIDHDEFVRRLGATFRVEEVSSADAARPGQRGDLGLRLADRWFHLRVLPEFVSSDPYDSLDAVILQDHILAPLLGIDDPRRDERLRFIGGRDAFAALAECSIGFALFPTSIQQVMEIADRGLTMPPKSTWFEPKLRGGIVVRLLD